MMRRRAVLELVVVYLVAAVAGFAGAEIGLPLPWMIGPLLSTATLVFTGLVTVVVPVATRPWGQGIVASQVGLYFTPAAFASLVERAPLLVGLALLTVVTAALVALILSRLAKIPISNALIATLPTSPVEASIIAERYGLAAAPTALTQTLRIAFVVVAIPMLIYAVDGRPPAVPTRTAAGPFDPLNAVLLMLVAVAGGQLFRKLRISNPYFLGPLAFVSLLTMADVQMTSIPAPILWGGQIILGTWLGSTFRRNLFERAGRLAMASLFTTILFIAATTASGVTLAWLLGEDWQLMVLATAPGGVTEMALTASFLGSNVALVTSIHITRIFIIVPSIPWIIELVHRVENRKSP